jgi:hypothetical protein
VKYLKANVCRLGIRGDSHGAEIRLKVLQGRNLVNVLRELGSQLGSISQCIDDLNPRLQSCRAIAFVASSEGRECARC